MSSSSAARDEPRTTTASRATKHTHRVNIVCTSQGIDHSTSAGFTLYSLEEVRRFHAGLPLLAFPESERRRLELAHDLHVRLVWNLLFQTQRPETAVDDQPAGALERKILRRAHCGREYAAGVAAVALVSLRPRHRHHRVVLFDFGVWLIHDRGRIRL